MSTKSNVAIASRPSPGQPREPVPGAAQPSSGIQLSERWNDALLDEMRKRGDPPADGVIESLLAHHELGEARRLLRLLVQNDSPPPEALPPEVLSYLRASEELAGTGLETIEAGQRFFEEHAPLILMCLACYSLPAAYAAAKGVTVLHRTAYLEKRPAKRLFETTQMVIDVMTPGGLERGGRGVRTAQKVRLMHAMVRHLLSRDPEWSEDLGVPINQEDLAGTLMTFSWITLDGLEKLGVEMSPDVRESYLAAWRAVGRLMGVDEELIPESVADAELLTRRIQSRQVRESDEGRSLTAALLEMLARNAPAHLQNMPAAMLRHFMPPEVATFLGVPRDGLAQRVVAALAFLSGRFDRLLHASWLLMSLARYFSAHFIQWVVDVDLGEKSAPFELPLRLRRRWRLDPATEPTLTERATRWLRRVVYGVSGR